MRKITLLAGLKGKYLMEKTGKPWICALEYASLIQLSDFSTDLLHPAAHAFQAIGHGLAEQIKQKNLPILN